MEEKYFHFFRRQHCLLFLFVFLLVEPEVSFTQQRVIDSLQTLLKKDKEDTIKINHLNDLAWELKYQNPDTSVLLSTQALQLSGKKEWRRGKALSYHQLGSFSFLNGDYATALKHYTDAIALWESLKDENGKAKTLGNIVSVYQAQGDYSRALEYSFTTLKIANELGNKHLYANTLSNIGAVYTEQGDYVRALDNYFNALKIAEELSDRNRIAILFGNIGVVYESQGDFPKALDYYFRALKTDEALGDKYGIASDVGNIGGVYWNLHDYSRALDYYLSSLKAFEELEAKDNVAISFSCIGNVYYEQKEYPTALNYYLKALKMDEELGDKKGIANDLGNVGGVYSKQDRYPQALDYYYKSLKIAREVGDKNLISITLGNIGSLYTSTKKYTEAEKYLLQALAMSDSIGALNIHKDHQNKLSDLYEQNGNYKQALEHYKKATALKDTLFTQEKNKEITRKAMNYEFDKREAVAKAEQDKKDAVTQQQMQKQKIIRNSTMAGLAAVLIFSFVVFGQKKKITKEKKRSDELLLNILPSEVAEELKLNGESEAKQFDDVTVLLSDFVNFTGASEKLSPKELVSEIHLCFTAFDEIIGRNGLEKIKTTGDAYMAVCGLPNADEQHATKTVTAAQEILKFMNERKKALGMKDGLGVVRIGINSGSVVAGIVGVKKFAYDIWGDTVNIAARMEQNCDAGKINISGSTYGLVKDKFTCIYRGKIEAKNKGEIDMYFVE